MKFFHGLQFLLGLVVVSYALPQAGSGTSSVELGKRRTQGKQALRVRDAQAIDIKDFLLTEMITTSAVNPAPDNTFDHSLSFKFTDLNSNTSSTCSQSWTESDTGSTAHFGPTYLVCATKHAELFQWFFASITSMKNFTLEVSHGFYDPAHYGTAYPYVNYFSTVPVELGCKTASGTTGCTLPPHQTPLRAVINGVSN